MHWVSAKLPPPNPTVTLNADTHLIKDTNQVAAKWFENAIFLTNSHKMVIENKKGLQQ